MRSVSHPVLLLPGSVLPGTLAFPALVDALGDRAVAVIKELEVYKSLAPPFGYTLDTEVAGVLHEADAHGWDTFHLVGYSGGGSVALATAARSGARLRSLSLLEPAWAGDWDWSPAHRQLWQTYRAIEALPAEEFMEAFRALQLQPGVPLPPLPPGPPPAWMAQRPAGIAALLHTFHTYDLSRKALEGYTRPVYFALGGHSNLDQYGDLADRLAGVFSDFTLEVFADRHHFDPPHRAEPQRLASALVALWDRA
jgi:pimeloyl-ACP methyl ester carboxylesterase